MYTNRWESDDRGYGYSNKIPDVNHLSKRRFRKLCKMIIGLLVILIIILTYTFITGLKDNDMLLKIASGIGILSLVMNLLNVYSELD